MMPFQPPASLQDRGQQSVRMTQIRFAGGLIITAPTDQWIACLFDVLHPTQQDAIIKRIEEIARVQHDRPLVEIPGFVQKEA